MLMILMRLKSQFTDTNCKKESSLKGIDSKENEMVKEKNFLRMVRIIKDIETMI